MMKKNYWEMDAAELAAATEKFDQPNAADDARPLTPAETAHWQQVKRKRGRPKTGQGFQRISLSIEKGLLQEVNAAVKKRKVSRSQFLAELLKKGLAQDA